MSSPYCDLDFLVGGGRGCRLSLPPLSPEGGRRGGGCRLSLPLVYLFAPPPSPRPPFPSGEGETFYFISPGAGAPGTLHLTACGTYRTCQAGTRRGACLLCRPPTCLTFFLPPSPQPPSPAGKGRPRLAFMQGASPLASPGLNPGGTERCHITRAGGGLVRLGCRLSLAVPESAGVACLCLSPAPVPLVLILPPSPQPPSRRGRGRLLVYFAGGFAPGIPCIKPPAALTEPAKQVPGAGRVRGSRAKSTGSAFLLAVPAAKERGDRGRWNYPSQATAAFEMVLSPGAGRANAARVQAGFKTHSRSG